MEEVSLTYLIWTSAKGYSKCHYQFGDIVFRNMPRSDLIWKSSSKAYDLKQSWISSETEELEALKLTVSNACYLCRKHQTHSGTSATKKYLEELRNSLITIFIHADKGAGIVIRNEKNYANKLQVVTEK